MEPNYKEIAKDLRFQYDKFIEEWLKAEKYTELKISLALSINHPYSTNKPLDITLYIDRLEKF